MSIAVSIVSTIIKSAVKSKVENELSNELYGISIDSISEKGINKINDFINKGKSKIDNILSEDKMKSMEISENNMAYVVVEIKELLSGIEITDEIFRQCKYDRFNLRDFLWNEYTENKMGFIECESDIKKALFVISETLIELIRKSEDFVKDISIQISNTVDDTRIEMREEFNILKENFNKLDSYNQMILDILWEILEQNEKNKKGSNVTQEEKFQNNKKKDYLKAWYSRLFLHVDNDERPITLKDAFIMPDLKIEGCDSSFTIYYDITVEKFIGLFIKNKKTSTLLIKGDPGMGKTSIISWLANENKINDRLFILKFRDWTEEDLKRGILKAIYNTLKCKKCDLDNQILVLDGFDEIKLLAKRENLLNEFLNDIKDLINTKIIITSRPTYIESHYFANSIVLLPFDIERISKFYKKIIGMDLDKNKIDNRNLNVLGIPVILYMAIMSNIDITKNVSKAELYAHIFAEKGGIFDKFGEYDNGSQIMRNVENIKKYLKFMKNLAFQMFERNVLYMKKSECIIPELVFQGEYVSILEFPIRYLFENTKVNIEFIHKSIYEYFVSEYFYQLINEKIDNIESCQELAGILGKWMILIDKKYISVEILDFLKYKIAGNLKDEFNIIHQTFQLMLEEGMSYYIEKRYKNIINIEMIIFINMLRFIQLWRNCYLEYNKSFRLYLSFCKGCNFNLNGMTLKRINLTGEDLTGIDLSGVDLESSDLSRSDLKGCNLIEVNFSHINLSQSDLRRADLSGSDLSNGILKEANLANADLIGTVLIKADLSYANLCNASLYGAEIKEAILDYSIWLESDIREIYNKLRDAIFSNIIIEQKDGSKINISRRELFSNEYLELCRNLS